MDNDVSHEVNKLFTNLHERLSKVEEKLGLSEQPAETESTTEEEHT